MSFQPFLVGDYRAGIQTNLDPWKLPGEAFQELNNMDMKDGVLSRRLGFRYFGRFTGCVGSISNITQANPGVVTTDGAHGLSDGDQVYIEGVSGMTEVNGNTYVVSGATALTFELSGTNTTSFTAYSSGGETSVAGQYPIMGFILHRDSNDDEDLLVANTKWIGTYDTTNGDFDCLSFQVATINAVTQANPGVVTTAANHGLANGDYVQIASVAGMTELNGNTYQVDNITATTFELKDVDTSGFTAYSSGGTVTLLSSHFTGDATNFISWVNYKDAVYMVNGSDQMLKYDGTNLSRVTMDYDNGGTNLVESALLVFVYKERLVVLNTVENGTRYPQRARWSKPGDPDEWHDQDNGGRGGYVDAPTGEPIVSAAFLKDNLIVFFRKSTWMLRYTGNAIVPFRWELINSTRKVEAPFGTVKFDKFVTGFGSTGILACDGFNIERIDKQIPDYVYNLNSDKIIQTFGYKFEETERVWWSVAENNSENLDSALVYHFEDNGWSTHSFTTQVPISAVTQADPAVVTTEIPHGLEDGLLVTIEDVAGMTELNDNEYVVENVTSTTFELKGVDSSGFTAYSSGGNVNLGSSISCFGEYSQQADDVRWQDVEESWVELERQWNAGRFQIGAATGLMGDANGYIWEMEKGGEDRAEYNGTDWVGLSYDSKLRTKRLNPYVEQGVNAELGYVDILFTADDVASVDVSFYVDSGGPAITIDEQSTIPVSLAADRGNDKRVWKRVYVGATASFHEMQIDITGKNQFVDIHAMIFWMRPSGRLELHA